jgi:hypothetical protein
VTDTTLELAGRSMRCVLHEDELRVGERVIDLAAIARVRLATLAEMSMCELVLRDGTTAVIANDARAKRASYGALIRELHGKLATRDGVEYVCGAWLLVGVMAGIGVLVVMFSAALWQGWITPPAILARRALLLMILGVAWLVLGPLLVWRSRPRGYDPHAVPADLVD